MKIALVGYGKMGKAIEKIALERGHEISLKITSQNREKITAAELAATDVAIEFTSPETAFENIQKLLSLKIPVVCGSTGWINKLREAEKISQQNGTPFLYASNFSPGVNIFFELNKKLASLMNGQHYKTSIKEIHHTAKKDAPSGTAITLAEQIISNIPSLNGWKKTKEFHEDYIAVESIRQDPAPGTHTITYSSAIDDISITHEAHSREGFAYGAVLAAEFIVGKTGVFSMKDVLDL